EIYGYRELSPGLIRRIARLIKIEKYDLVQSNLVHADLWIVVPNFFNRKLKVVSVKHGFDEPYSARYGNDPKHLWKSSSGSKILRLVFQLQYHCVKDFMTCMSMEK
ncbi:MAG: hypothetical protein IPP39_15565, partial [Chitinophagaceae bacterium]|nr:hypothetical protein [Chitinophagaceae bacterium]